MASQGTLRTSLEERARETGIDAVGAVPWGMHLCSFYDTKQDLIDILVPYFKVGLESNESCIWVTSKPCSEKEAEEAMRQTVPNFAQYLERGQIEIIPHTEWYLKGGTFNKQRVLGAWIDKLNQALAKGYDGIRATGDAAWLEKGGWRRFADYEEEVNNIIGKYRMLAICTYPLAECGANEMIEVMRNHQFGLIRRAGEWMLIKPRESQEITSLVLLRGRMSLLRERFIRSGFEGFSDQEVIELLLSLALSSRECKRLSKECIKAFKDIRGLLSASPQELEQVGFTSSCMFCIKLLHELPTEVLKKKIIDKPLYQSSKEVFDYLSYSMRDLKKEVFKAIYLNSRNQIIDTVTLFEGTLESIPIRPREIVESAIEHRAVAVVFVHNHPSGDPAPSKSDKQLTRDLVFVGNIVQIKVLDHIVIGDNSYFSFADEGLIKKYELDFLDLRINTTFDRGTSYSGVTLTNS